MLRPQSTRTCASDLSTGMQSKRGHASMSRDEHQGSPAEVHDHLFTATDESTRRRTPIEVEEKQPARQAKQEKLPRNQLQPLAGGNRVGTSGTCSSGERAVLRSKQPPPAHARSLKISRTQISRYFTRLSPGYPGGQVPQDGRFDRID